MSTPEVRLDALSAFPLPPLADVSDKEGRGRVLVVAGGRRVPGAAILTGVAALRAGAGKLQLAAPASMAIHLGLAIPEAAVVGVSETADGEIGPEAADALTGLLSKADAVAIGPGMVDEQGAAALCEHLMSGEGDAAFVVDAAAMTGLCLSAGWTGHRGGRLVLTPHAGEMAALSGTSKSAVESDPLAAARRLAAAAQAVVVMKGAETFIVSPEGRAWRHLGGTVGLATSGSGDVLTGLIAGLLARGAAPLTAAVWGVCVHGGAGAHLAETIGDVGFLAREILDVVPQVLRTATAKA